MLKENYRNVQENIQRACEKVNRSVDEVTLISVSKTKPLSMLQEAYDCGAREYGENKVQEMTEKEGQLPKDIHWHMIGHLQTNKVKYIAPYVHLIHSVDSLKLAQEINRQGEKCNRSIPILIEVNIAEEESKFGIHKEETYELVRQIATLPHVHICGLMTIAPFVDDPEENRQVFRDLKQLSVDISQKNMNNINMRVLSMGMTGDYQVAVEEGATMVRVGTGIFGARNYAI